MQNPINVAFFLFTCSHSNHCYSIDSLTVGLNWNIRISCLNYSTTCFIIIFSVFFFLNLQNTRVATAERFVLISLGLMLPSTNLRLRKPSNVVVVCFIFFIFSTKQTIFFFVPVDDITWFGIALLVVSCYSTQNTLKNIIEPRGF